MSRLLQRKRRSDQAATRVSPQGEITYFAGAYLPKEVHQALCDEANANERTITRQLVWILKQHFGMTGDLNGQQK